MVSSASFSWTSHTRSQMSRYSWITSAVRLSVIYLIEFPLGRAEETVVMQIERRSMRLVSVGAKSWMAQP